MSNGRKFISLLIVEDGPELGAAMQEAMEKTGSVTVLHISSTGEDAVDYCHRSLPDAILMDINLGSGINGIEAAQQIRRDHGRVPIVFYTMYDNPMYYRQFLQSTGFRSHFAFVNRTRYPMVEHVLPLLCDAIDGKAFIEPAIDDRMHEVEEIDKLTPFRLLEPSEYEVLKFMVQGLTNHQIADRISCSMQSVKQHVSSIYTRWEINQLESVTDDTKRARAILIALTNLHLKWDDMGDVYHQDAQGREIIWKPSLD